MLEQMAKGDMPGERELRTIAAASVEDQAEVWKKHRPKKNETVSWWSVAQALDKQRMFAKDAKFDDDLARAYGIADPAAQQLACVEHAAMVAALHACDRAQLDALAFSHMNRARALYVEKFLVR